MFLREGQEGSRCIKHACFFLSPSLHNPLSRSFCNLKGFGGVSAVVGSARAGVIRNELQSTNGPIVVAISIHVYNSIYISPSTLCPFVRDKSRCFESANLFHPSPFSLDTLSPLFLHPLSQLLCTLFAWFFRSWIAYMYMHASEMQLVSSTIASREIKDVSDRYFKNCRADWIASIMHIPFSSCLADSCRFDLPPGFHPAFLILSNRGRSPFLIFLFCGKRWKELGENWDIKRREKKNKELEQRGKRGGDYGEMREEEKCSRSDDQKQFACGLAWSIFEKEREDAARVRLASFYAALCLWPLGSYLSVAPPFILFSILSIPLSRVARNPAWLHELWHLESTISQCAAELWNHISLDEEWWKPVNSCALRTKFMRKWSKF